MAPDPAPSDLDPLLVFLNTTERRYPYYRKHKVKRDVQGWNTCLPNCAEHVQLQVPGTGGYSARTVEAYVRAVCQLARVYGSSPDRLTEEQVRDYLLHLTRVQKVARGTHTIALCGIKFFYEKTLGRSLRRRS